MNLINYTRQKYLTFCLLLFSFVSTNVLAELPVVVPPEGAVAGDYIDMGQRYFYKAVLVVGLILATWAFIAVIKNMVSTYSKIEGREATWGQFGTHAVTGFILIVIVVFMISEFSTILAP